MAFPETSVLSTFTLADLTSPVTGFSNVSGPASKAYLNMGTGYDSSGYATNYWNAGTFTQPVDCTELWAHSGVAGELIGVVFVQNPGASWNGYQAIYYKTGSLLLVSRFDSGVETSIGSGISFSMSQGDSLGVRLHTSGHVEFYTKTGAGAWTSRGIGATDTTYTGEFYVGYVALCYDTGTDGQAIDDFSAGEAVEDEVTGQAHLLSGKLFGLLGGKIR